MKARRINIIILLVFSLLSFSSLVDTLSTRSYFPRQVLADETQDKANELRDKIEKLEAKLKETGIKRTTLASEISYQTNQIKLTKLKISQTTAEINQLNQEIEKLSIKIGQLNSSLDYLSEVLVNRVRATYKYSRYNPITWLLSSHGLTQVFNRMKYLELSQKNDKSALLKLETARTNYDSQKQIKLEKQAELENLENKLENQKANLASQRAIKQDLLVQTQNDEKRFQALLAQARTELESIQAIIAGRGDEEEAGEVKKGDTIAYVISGSSCNSTGTHLHFMVKQGTAVLNPFSYLGSIDYENCSGSSCGSGDGDPFNPSGSWIWPLDPKIKFSQGYGRTWAVRNTWVSRIYSFHNGIDIKGGSSRVKAVADGTLYRGSYSGSGGCALQYVRLDHKDSELETFYLHVNYF